MTRDDCKLDLSRDAPSRAVWVTLSTTGELLNLWDAVSMRIESYRNDPVRECPLRPGDKILPLQCHRTREDNIKATQALGHLLALVRVHNSKGPKA